MPIEKDGLVQRDTARALGRVGCFVIVVSLAIGCSDAPGEVGGAVERDREAEPDAQTSIVLAVATYNVEGFSLGGASDGQYAQIAAWAKDSQLDVLVVQEAQGDDGDELRFTAALTAIGYPLPYHFLCVMSDGHNALGVWSRYPLSSVEEILRENTRAVLRVEVQIGQDARLWLYGCHLKSGADAVSRARREREAARLEQYILTHHDPRSEHIVVLGDMNTMSDGDWLAGGTLSHLILQSDNPAHAGNDLTAVNAEVLPHAYTYPSGKSLLDHILLSPAALLHYLDGSVQVGHQESPGGRSPSDHYPVLLRLAY